LVLALLSDDLQTTRDVEEASEVVEAVRKKTVVCCYPPAAPINFGFLGLLLIETPCNARYG
jgi:hypothetical protein